MEYPSLTRVKPLIPDFSTVDPFFFRTRPLSIDTALPYLRVRSCSEERLLKTAPSLPRQPDPPPDVRAIRTALGLNQQDFAASFGLSLSTLRDWEQNRRTPEGPARTLLKVIAANPNVVQHALQTSGVLAGKHSAEPGGSAVKVEQLDSFTAHWMKEYPNLNVAELQFKAAIALIATMVESEFRVLARSMLKISEGELRVLLTLRRSSKYALQPTALFRNLLVTSSAGTKQIQRLEKRRMIRKIPNRTGKRFLIGLTPKGDRVVDAAFARSRSAFVISDAAFESLTPADQASGIDFLRQLLVAISSRQPGRPSERGRPR